ncbi:MAG TPA: flagellin [Caulobacteraceae bacterium]|jgi:flagellar hook-associated protein 3 FlgL
MDRIATNTAYSNVLNNLMAAELAQTSAGNQLASTEKADDLQGYGAESETITALQATTSQVTGYLNNSQTVSAKLSTQDSALNEVSGAAGSAISAITNALATSNGDTLMSSLQNAFETAIEGLNTTYNGEYLFSGGQVNTAAVSATNLTDLTTAPSLSSLFHNDQRQTASQIDQNTSLNTGFLADAVGTPLFQALQSIQTYVDTNGAFSGTLTTAQSQFLTSTIQNLGTVQTNLNNVVGQNGLMQSEVTNAQGDLTSRQTMLQGLLNTDTGADLAKASSNLQQAQLAIQAAGQVFQALNASSLLNLLPVSSTG